MNDKRRRFEQQVLPQLDAAYCLARWLVRDEHVAEDVVQDAFLRAYEYFDSFRGGPCRPWLLQIVRNVCNNWFVRQRREHELVCQDDELSAQQPGLDGSGQIETPQTLLAQSLERQQVNEAIAALAVPLREVLVLREIEEMSYAEIATVLGVPQGTVMSRLSRARGELRLRFKAIARETGKHAV